MEYGFAFFPGQGAQHSGMGRDLYENNAAAKEIFDRASAVAQTDVRELCFESTQEELNRTVHSQIAIFTHSFAHMQHCLTQVFASVHVQASLLENIPP